MAAGVFFFPFEVAPDLEQWIITAVKMVFGGIRSCNG